MKYIPRHTQSIEIEFVNKKNKLICFRATIPYNNIKHNISKWYRVTKEAVATSESVPLWQVSGTHKIIKSESFDRILFEWPGGIALDMPSNMNLYDYRIILAQLEVIKMSAKN